MQGAAVGVPGLRRDAEGDQQVKLRSARALQAPRGRGRGRGLSRSRTDEHGSPSSPGQHRRRAAPRSSECKGDTRGDQHRRGRPRRTGRHRCRTSHGVPALHRGAGVGYARRRTAGTHREAGTRRLRSRVDLHCRTAFVAQTIATQTHAQGRLGHPRLRVRVRKSALRRTEVVDRRRWDAHARDSGSVLGPRAPRRGCERRRRPDIPEPTKRSSRPASSGPAGGLVKPRSRSTWRHAPSTARSAASTTLIPRPITTRSSKRSSAASHRQQSC